MDDSEVITEVGHVAAFRFIRLLITQSEASYFTAVKAMRAVDDEFAKIHDHVETNNPMSKTTLEKFERTFATNHDLKVVAALANGDGVSDPAQIEIYSFARCTSVDVERLFSVSKHFVADRPHILDDTVNKLMFVKYNKHL